MRNVSKSMFLYLSTLPVTKPSLSDGRGGGLPDVALVVIDKIGV